MPRVNCKICNVDFYIKPSHQKLGYGKYCSKKCQSCGQKNGAWLNCSNCNEKTWRSKNSQLRSKSGKFFCSKSCQTTWRNQYFSGDKHWNWKLGRSVEYRRLLERANIEKKCRRCGQVDIRTLAVHHIDKNRANNDEKNLIYLCMNCHFLVHRYNEAV